MSFECNDTVVLGLGNRFAGDDAVGPLVVERVAARLPGIKLIEGAGDALAILAALEGFAHAIIVDAAISGNAPGTLHRLENDELLRPNALARCSSHGGGLSEALALAAALGRRLPALVVHAVEIESLAPGAAPSRAVELAIDALVIRIVDEIESVKYNSRPFVA